MDNGERGFPGPTRAGRIVLHVGKPVRLAQADVQYSPECSVFIKMAFIQMVLSTYSPKIGEFLSFYSYGQRSQGYWGIQLVGFGSGFGLVLVTGLVQDFPTWSERNRILGTRRVATSFRFCSTGLLSSVLHTGPEVARLVGRSLTSLFSTNMATSEMKGQGWRVILLPSGGRLVIY